MKKLLVIITMLLSIGLMVACADNQAHYENGEPYATATDPTPEPVPPTPEPTYEPEEEQDDELEEPEDVAEPTISETSSDLSDDLFSFTLQLNGVIYTLPFPYADIVANGWEWDNPREVALNPNQRGPVKLMRSGDNTIMLSTANTSQDVVETEDSNVGVIELDSFNAPRGAELIFPGGITIGTPYEEVLAIHGEPSERRQAGEDALSKGLIYSVDAYATVRINICRETYLVNGLRMENVFAREALPAFEGDLPLAVLAYVAPTDLGDSWDTFYVRLAGELYSIPAPVQAFVDNGWIIEGDPNEMIPANTSMSLMRLRHGNQVMRINVNNYDNQAQPLSHSFVTRVEFSHTGAVLPIEIPGGITENSTLDDVFDALGEPNNDADNNNFRTLTYGSIWRQVVITFLIDSGDLHSIVVEHAPRDLN